MYGRTEAVQLVISLMPLHTVSDSDFGALGLILRPSGSVYSTTSQPCWRS